MVMRKLRMDLGNGAEPGVQPGKTSVGLGSHPVKNDTTITPTPPFLSVWQIRRAALSTPAAASLDPLLKPTLPPA